ncbi:MAG: peptidoglycan DD-metalloendopeptidase family protein [Chitinophagaceae bacterium]
MNSESRNIFTRNQASFFPVIKFDPEKEKLLQLDFTANNNELTADMVENTLFFSAYINNKLEKTHCKFGIGGYGEHRTVYRRSRVFDAVTSLDEPRRWHLGTDIWGAAGTAVYAPIGGMVHGFAFNDKFGDYGATMILLHQLDGFPFYTLYGHVSLRDISLLREGQYIIGGEEMAHFGEPHENGHWPPHLHFQIIFDIGVNEGDYPGVCKFTERERYMNNCPDPDLILQINRYIAEV